MLKLKTDNGQLTDYGFECGYVEKIDTAHVSATVKKMFGCYRIVGFVGSKWFIVNRSNLKDIRRIANRFRSLNLR